MHAETQKGPDGTQEGPENTNVEDIAARARRHNFHLLDRTGRHEEGALEAFDAEGQSLAGKDLSDIDFYDGRGHGPNFSNCDCRGTNFSNANLFCAWFHKADLRGADFTGANLRDAWVDDIIVDETTKGLERFHDASAQYMHLSSMAAKCGGTADGMLRAFGGVPTKEQLQPYLVDQKEFIHWRVDTNSYVRSWERAKQDGSLIIKSVNGYQRHDSFGHAPEDDFEKWFQPPINIDTPPEELFKTSKGFSTFHLSHDMIQDVPGRGLYNCNTRHLSEIGKIAIDYYQGENITFLDSGAGAGVAAGDASLNKNVTVDTMGLSPTSPTIRLTKDWKEIYESIATAFDHQNKSWEYWQKILTIRGVEPMYQAGIKRLYYCTKDGIERLLHPIFELKTRLSFVLNDLFPQLKIFSVSKTPYIRKQFVGEYPAGVELQNGEYDVIHDDNGPLWHLSRISVEGGKREASISTLVKMLCEKLSRRGCIVCTRIEAGQEQGLEELGALLKQGYGVKYYYAIQDIELAMRSYQDRVYGHQSNVPEWKWPFQNGDLLLMGTEKDPSFVFAKRNSPIAQKMSKLLSLKYDEGGFFRVPDLLEKLKS